MTCGRLFTAVLRSPIHHAYLWAYRLLREHIHCLHRHESSFRGTIHCLSLSDTFQGHVCLPGFCRFRCSDKTCINNCAAIHYKAGFIKALINIYKDFPANLIFFKHMAELQHSDYIWYLLFMKIVHKRAHCIAVIDRIFDSFI